MWTLKFCLDLLEVKWKCLSPIYVFPREEEEEEEQEELGGFQLLTDDEAFASEEVWTDGARQLLDKMDNSIYLPRFLIYPSMQSTTTSTTSYWNVFSEQTLGHLKDLFSIMVQWRMEIVRNMPDVLVSC